MVCQAARASSRIRHRLGSATLEIVTGSATVIARHHLAPAGAGAIVRLPEHRAALESAVLSAFSAAALCRRKENRPPGPEARALAAALLGTEAGEVTVDLGRYAEFAKATSRPPPPVSTSSSAATSPTCGWTPPPRCKDA
jgi:hypothetical protein